MRPKAKNKKILGWHHLGNPDLNRPFAKGRVVQSVKCFIFVHGWKTNFKCTCIKKKKISQLVILIMNVFLVGHGQF